MKAGDIDAADAGRWRGKNRGCCDRAVRCNAAPRRWHHHADEWVLGAAEDLKVARHALEWYTTRIAESFSCPLVPDSSLTRLISAAHELIVCPLVAYSNIGRVSRRGASPGQGLVWS
jgi:hypothetical protein